MSPVQRAISQRNKALIIGAGVIVAGLWVLLVMYLLRESRNAINEIQPGAVAVSSAPTFSSSPSASFSSPRSNAPLLHHNIPSTPLVYRSVTPNQSMGSTSSFKIHQTSDATSQSVGGGSSAPVIAMTSSSSSGKGIHTSTASYSGAIYLPLANNAITAVGAANADEIVNQKMGVIRRAKMDGDDGYAQDREDPIPDEVITPLGDITWALMALLAAVYAFFCYRRRTRA